MKDISVLGRATQGVTLMRTSGDEKVVSIDNFLIIQYFSIIFYPPITALMPCSAN